MYFDNNATTPCCEAAKKEHAKYISAPNPSSSSKEAQKIAEKIQNVREKILEHCFVSSETHDVIFTSGASESNNLVIRSVVSGVEHPEIITTPIEHNTSLQCMKDVNAHVKFCEISTTGEIVSIPETTPNCVLVSIMAANNEIPVENKVEDMKFDVPFHVDAVPLFGKKRINLKNIDACSASSHKFYGPKGVGLLIIKKTFPLKAQICGSQQHGLRGGTENVAGILSMYAALVDTFKNRDKKNEKLQEMRQIILDVLRPVNWDQGPFDKDCMVYVGPYSSKSNTLLLAFYKRNGEKFCNLKLKKMLEDKKCIVSIGSACNTYSKNASHVLQAIKADDFLRRGIFRISFGDKNTIDEAKKLAQVLRKICFDFLKF